MKDFLKKYYIKIKALQRSRQLKALEQDIFSYYSKQKYVDLEISEALGFIKNHGINIFPYPFVSNYKSHEIKVFRDHTSGLPYVKVDDKRLYYKRDWTDQQVKSSHKMSLLEQDPNSPHRYLTDTFKVSPNATVIDAGAAEGNFSLSVVEKVKKIYLFEQNKNWIEALHATFTPWKNKVEIIERYVCDRNSSTEIKLDSCLNAGEIDFIKIDVDGAESRLLEGADNLISNSKKMQISLCTYHKQNDASDFDLWLQTKGYKTEFSSGYMLFYFDKIYPPFFRKGIIRASKT